MRLNPKTRAFLAFSLRLLGYRKMTTAVNIFCNAIIFSHQAAVTFCIREMLNGLERNPGTALRSAVPFLVGILIVSLIRVAAIMGCAVLDGLRAYYYQNRLRMNILKGLFAKPDITAVSGRSGAIFEVLDDDVPAATFPAELLTEVSGYFIYTLIALTMLLLINWRLTLFIFIPLSAAIFGVQRLSEHMKERRRHNRMAHDTASTFISDVADATLAIKTAGASGAVLRRYDEVNALRSAAVMRDAAFNERVSVLLNGAVCIGTVVMMFIAAGLMAGESFGIGDFSLFIAHLGTLADCVNRIVELIYEARKAEVSYERIMEAVGHEDAKALADAVNIGLRDMAAEAASEVPALSFTSFSINRLGYTYSGEQGFKDVSFTVRPGQLVAVAGGVASGKSTLLSVLMGLMPPEEGDMLLDGRPVDGMRREPGLIAGAPQRGGFFAADIHTNLCLGMRPDNEHIAQALSIAALDDLQSENIGDHGDKLSGGQRQRLSIARTILRGAAVNVIDDCISALDRKTRDEVLRRLRAYLAQSGNSLIIATNSLAFLESADTILFMDTGRLAGAGGFQEVMAACPGFRAVVSRT